MPALTIELKKGRNGPTSLACVRADGSRTWARVHPFLPIHDLNHCAVESVLGFNEAFWGLVAGGWELDDFASPGAAGRLPPQALWAEHLVGLIERKVASSASGLNEALAASLPEGLRQGAPVVTDADLEAIERLRTRLKTRWESTPAGGTLRVGFPANRAGV
jgi:hypothetical protein